MSNDYGLPQGPLAAYLSVRDNNNRQGLVDAQQQHMQLGMLAQIQRMAQEKQLQEAIAGGNPEALMRTPGGMDILTKQAALRNAGTNDQLHQAQILDLENKGRARDQQAGSLAALQAEFSPQAYNAQHPELTHPVDSVSMNDAQALEALKAAEARGQPFSTVVPNQARVQGLAMGADPKEAIKALIKSPSQASMSPLGRLMSERDALPPNDPRRRDYDRVIANAQSGGGSSVTVSPTLNLGKEASNKVDTGLLDTSKGIMTLATIEGQFKPEYQELSSRVSAEWSSVKDKMGIGLNTRDRAFLTDFSAYKRNAINSMNEYIKSITGAAMSEAEAGRILRGMPNAGQGIFDGDSPTEFKAKLDDATKQTKLALARYEYIKRNGIGLSGPDGNPTVPLERMPQIMNERGQQLETQFKTANIPPDQIQARVRQMLAREFGLVQ